MSPRHEELIAGYFDGSLSEGERTELLQAVRVSVDVADAFADELEIHRLLDFSGGRNQDSDRKAEARIHHFVQASHEDTKFFEQVKRRALAPAPAARRRSLASARRRTRPGSLGPLFIAAGVLLGLVVVLAISTSGPAPTSRTAERDLVPPPTDTLRETARTHAVPPEPARVPPPHGKPKPSPAAKPGKSRVEDKVREPGSATPPPRPSQPPRRRPGTEVLRAAVAVLKSIEGTAELSGTAGGPARPGAKLISGQGVRTVGPDSRAVLAYPDGTRLELGPDTAVRELTAGAGGKRLTLDQGELAAAVTRQPPGRPMIVGTPHAEARVLGTTLKLEVLRGKLEWTRLDVTEGKVRLTRRSDGRHVDVRRGQVAVAREGTRLAARALPAVLLTEDFDRGRWGPAWTVTGDPRSTLTWKVEGGYLSRPFTQQVTPDKIVGGGKRRSLALVTRRAFPIRPETPIRVRYRQWQSNSDTKFFNWISLTDAGDLVIMRRGDEIRIYRPQGSVILWQKAVSGGARWETVEVWLTPDEIALRMDGATLYTGMNPSRGRAVRLSLSGNATIRLDQDSEIRLDDIEVSRMTPEDFEKIRR